MKHTIKFGLQTGQQFVDFEQVRELWQKADGWGYDSLWCFDHFFPIFVPDPNGRAALTLELPQPNARPTVQPWTLEQAMTEARKLLPKDAQPPNPQPEGSDQFVVERFTSQALGQALPAQVFAANNGQTGQFMVVYVKDATSGGRITRIIIGAGNDPQALLNQGR